MSGGKPNIKNSLVKDHPNHDAASSGSNCKDISMISDRQFHFLRNRIVFTDVVEVKKKRRKRNASENPATVSKSMDFVAFFPEELTDTIFSHLLPDDLDSCKKVSELWNEVTNNFIQRRKLRMKINWENGRYSRHYIPIDIEMIKSTLFLGDDAIITEVSHLVELLPSSKNDSDFYFPICVSFVDDYECNLILLHCDANLKTRFEEVKYFPCREDIKKICVMGESVVWLTHNRVGHYDGKLPEGSREKTVARLKNHNNRYSLTMDSEDIVVWNSQGALKVWCKQTNKLKVKLQIRNVWKCSLFDGCLVAVTGKHRHKSKIEIVNLRINGCQRLQHTCVVDGVVEDINSNDRWICFSSINRKGYFRIDVLDKENCVTKQARTVASLYKIYDVHNDHIIFQKLGNLFKFAVLDLSSGELLPVSSNMQLKSGLGHFFVKRKVSNNSIEVFDLKDTAKPYTLKRKDCVRGTSFIVTVNESMIVDFCTDVSYKKAMFIVYKFD